MLQLFRYERVLGTAGDAGYGALLVACYDRVLWLLEGRPPEDAGVRAIEAAVEAWERCGAALELARAQLAGVLERVRDDAGAAPGLRGAALGALWVLEVADDDALVAGPVQFADPEHLGDFLYGLFKLAREPVQRRRDLIERVDEVVMAFGDGQFLEALPALAARVQRVHAAREGPVGALAARRRGGRRGRQHGRAGDARGDARAGGSPAHGARDLRGPVVSGDRRARWRLVLGGDAESALGAAGDPRMDRALEFLYSREAGEERNVRGGSLDDSQLTVPEWINAVHELFPRRVVERLEQDALDRYGLLEIVTSKEVLERARPTWRC